MDKTVPAVTAGWAIPPDGWGRIVTGAGRLRLWLVTGPLSVHAPFNTLPVPFMPSAAPGYVPFPVKKMIPFCWVAEIKRDRRKCSLSSYGSWKQQCSHGEVEEVQIYVLGWRVFAQRYAYVTAKEQQNLETKIWHRILSFPAHRLIPYFVALAVLLWLICTTLSI